MSSFLALQSFAQVTIPRETTEPDTIVKDGQVVPYAGVLTSEKSYRYYRKQDALAVRLDKQLKDLDFCSHDLPQADNTALYIGLSLILGAAAGYYAGQSR